MSHGEMVNRVKSWVDVANTIIAENNSVIEWSDDDSLAEFHWETTKKAGVKAREQNKMLKEALDLIENAYF